MARTFTHRTRGRSCYRAFDHLSAKCSLVARKRGVVGFPVPPGKQPEAYARELLGDPRLGPNGPAGAVRLGKQEWLIVGVVAD